MEALKTPNLIQNVEDDVVIFHAMFLVFIV